MKLSKLKLEDNDILSIRYYSDEYPVNSKGNTISDAEFQDRVYGIFKDMYPDLNIAIFMNADISKLDLEEKEMNKLGWYKKDKD